MSIGTPQRHWRTTALSGFLTLLAATVSPAFSQTAQAHTGTPGTLCGSVDIYPTAVYLGQYDAGGAHYHRWQFPGPTYHDEQC